MPKISIAPKEGKMLKKTIAVHPIMDEYIRKTWAILIDKGYEASYSTALNFMVLGAIMEAVEGKGWNNKTRETVWSFLEDEKIIKELNPQDCFIRLREAISGEVV